MTVQEQIRALQAAHDAAEAELAKAKRTEAEMRAAGLVQVPRPETRNGKTVMVKRWVRPEASADALPLGHAADLAPSSVVWRTARNAKHLGRYGDFVVEEHENKAHDSHRFKVRQWSDLSPWPGIGYASMTAEQAHDLARHLAERQRAGVSPQDATHEWTERHPDPTDYEPDARTRAIMDKVSGVTPRPLLDEHADHLTRMEREARAAGHHEHADRLAAVREAMRAPTSGAGDPTDAAADPTSAHVAARLDAVRAIRVPHAYFDEDRGRATLDAPYKIDGALVRFWARKSDAQDAAVAIGWTRGDVRKVATRFQVGWAIGDDFGLLRKDWVDKRLTEARGAP